MAHLRKQDYFNTISEADLDVIVKDATQISKVVAYSPDTIREKAEEKVIEKVSSMICHRYDVGLIFTDILTWNVNTQYNINDLVQYSETAYSETATYSVNDLVSFKTTTNGILADDIYKNTVAVTAPEVFNSSRWTKQASNNLLYVVREPIITTKPLTDFVYTTNLFTGNHDTIKGWDTTNDLFFKRDAAQVKIYYSAADRTADTNSIGVVDVGTQVKDFRKILPIASGNDAENTLSGNLTIIGFMPDLTTWSVLATNPFQPEDNRSKLIIDIVIDLVLFRLHGLINPRFIPDFRGNAKDDAMIWLDEVAKGNITPKLPLLPEDTRSNRVTFGSEEKLNHNYFY